MFKSLRNLYIYCSIALISYSNQNFMLALTSEIRCFLTARLQLQQTHWTQSFRSDKESRATRGPINENISFFKETVNYWQGSYRFHFTLRDDPNKINIKTVSINPRRTFKIGISWIFTSVEDLNWTWTCVGRSTGIKVPCCGIILNKSSRFSLCGSRIKSRSEIAFKH